MFRCIPFFYKSMKNIKWTTTLTIILIENMVHNSKEYCKYIEFN